MRRLIIAATLTGVLGCSPPRPLERPRPRYPDMLREARVSGTEIARLRVDRHGVVSDVTFDSTAHIHDLFTVSARNTLRAVRFRPATRFGIAHAGVFRYSIHYFLGGPPSAERGTLSSGDSVPGCPRARDETHLVVCSVPLLSHARTTH
ncbi:MAG: energy transducer TonB [Gemmatimonadaceae bacterium]